MFTTKFSSTSQFKNHVELFLTFLDKNRAQWAAIATKFSPILIGLN